MHQLDQTFPQEQNQRDLLIMTLSPHASGKTAWDQSNEISTITPEKPLVWSDDVHSHWQIVGIPPPRKKKGGSGGSWNKRYGLINLEPKWHQDWSILTTMWHRGEHPKWNKSQCLQGDHLSNKINWGWTTSNEHQMKSQHEHASNQTKTEQHWCVEELTIDPLIPTKPDRR